MYVHNPIQIGGNDKELFLIWLLYRYYFSLVN